MQLAIDASRAARPNPTGTERYSRQIINELVPIAAHHEVTLYYDRPPESQHGAAHVRTRVIPSPRLWTHGRLTVELIRERPDVLFVPAHVIPAVHPTTVVTIHDLGYLRYRLAYRPAAWIYLFLSTRWSARAARTILVDSHATRSDLLRHVEVAPAKVQVVHLGVDARFRPAPEVEIARVRSALGLPAQYLLFVGTLQPRKNLPRLLRAYARARRTTDHPSLVIAGAAGLGSDKIRRNIEELGLVDAVRLVGYADDRMLPALYSGAEALLFPSLYEGFGLPLLEAMACGTPVLAGNNSSMPEVVGDAGLLIDATSEAAIADAITRLCGDLNLRERLIERGRQQAGSFSWERTARETLAILEKASN